MSRGNFGWMGGNRNGLPRILFLVLLAAVVALMIAPNHALQALIGKSDFARGVARFFYSAAPGVQIHHLLCFAAVGFAAHIGWPAWRAWQVALGLYVVAGMTELVQMWVPGRVSSIWHVVLDVAGGLTGFLIAWLMTYAWGNESFARHAEPAPD